MQLRRTLGVLVILFTLVLLMCTVVRGENRTSATVPKVVTEERDTLRGLLEVQVIVEGLEPGARQLGLSEQALRTDVERQLRQYGIRVASDEQYLKTAVVPILYLRVHTLSTEGVPFIPVSVDVELQQMVLLAREPAVYCVAATWMTGSMAVVGLSDGRRVRDSVRDSVAKFINDYLAVNPKGEFQGGIKGNQGESRGN